MPDFAPDLYEEEEDNNPSQQTGPFQQLRKHARALEKELKTREKELEELKSFKAEVENRQKRELLERSFEQVGLNVKHAELFAAVRPDAEPTVEAVRAFAVEYGFISAPADDEEESESDGFSPTPPSGVPAHKKRLTSEEFDSLYKSNPLEAMKAAEEGRVDFQKTL